MKEKIKKKERGKVEKSLKYSIKEGSATSFMSGAGESYIVPFALALNASNAQIGYLTSFVGLFRSFSQIFGSRAVYNVSRKKIVLVSVFSQALIWVLISLLGFLVWKGVVNAYAAIFLIIIYSIYGIVASFPGPAWFSWTGDLVPNERRGDYFANRNKIVGIVSMTVTLIAAFFLDYSEGSGFLLLGFIVLFLIAASGRFVSGYYFTKHYEPNAEFNREGYFTLLQFIKKAPFNNFGTFVIFVALINMATNFAAPFFAVYMLKELGFNYFWFIVVGISGTLFTIIAMPMWGKVGDAYGNRTLLKIGSFLIVLPPFLWLFVDKPLEIIFSVSVFGGFGWAAFNLAASNFIYDAVTPQRRAICVAYHTVFSGIGVFVGALLGGLFVEYVSLSFTNIFFAVFFISSFLRGVFGLIFIPRIKEVRNFPSFEKRIGALTYATLLIPGPFYSLFRGVRGAFGSVGEHAKNVVKRKS